MTGEIRAFIDPRGSANPGQDERSALEAALASEQVRDLVFSFSRIQSGPLRQAALGAVRAAEAASRTAP